MHKLFKRNLSAFCFGIFISITSCFAQQRQYYQESTWTPRAILPYNDAINNDFWPQSPKVNNTYNDPDFDEQRLSQVPAPGVYPRVLMTPKDIDIIRAKLALGNKAPATFKTLWERESKIKGAFYALVTKNDTLGKQLARQLVAKLHSIGPKIDMMDRQPDRDNIWAVERSIIASGEPDPPSEIYELLDYDYLHDWMTADEQELARSVIARLTFHRISNFLMVPDHFMINNHEGFGMEYIRLMLLIEGQKGFDQKLFDLACHKANAMLDWYLDDDGMCYESIKGWLNISAFVAVGQRQRNLLKHDHLRAKMHFFQAALRWEDGTWHIRDEMRASAFHVIWMMHYYHPKDLGIDLLYKATLTTHPFLTDANAKWPDPVGISRELLLLYADDGILDDKGNPIDWNDQQRINNLKLPLTWKDDQRGYVDVRNSWRKDDLHVGFVCKQDFFYGGHEGSEDNRLTLWKDGVNWIQDNNMLATKATFLQNMITVDGKGCHWPPAPGAWLGVNETEAGLTASGDGKDGFTYSKSMQIHPLNFPSAKLGYYAPFAEGNFDMSRDLQVAFNPRTVKYNDGYAHTDYGPWSGETRLVENYRLFNPMQQAYRTIQVAKGTNPYLLVIDDVKKDEQLHQFDWNISVPQDVELIEALTPEVVFQNTEPSDIRTDDLILGKNNIARDPLSGKLKPKKGDPLCLVRVLWRNTEYGFPVPHMEKFEGYNQVTIPARAVSPEFRVLVYPYKYGEELPKTVWNKDRTELTVSFKNQTDVYHFGAADGGRTVLEMQRNGIEVLKSKTAPARPVLIVRGDKFDSNDLRYTRYENNIPTFLIDTVEKVQFAHALAPALIRYTLDGSEPDQTSPIYDAPIAINKTCNLKAKVFDPTWLQGPSRSETLTAHFVVRTAETGLKRPLSNANTGLLVQVFEKNTKLYNNKGFFDANRVMIPDLKKEKEILTTNVSGFALPQVTPTHPLTEQCKGFYKFTGLFWAKERGVYKFDLNSCGPVTFDIGSQTAIENTGVFHQQQAHRYGEASLDKGWHKIELVICDPLFWNINSLEPMPFEMHYQINGGAKQNVDEKELVFEPAGNLSITKTPKLVWHEALKTDFMLEPGFDLAVYDRTGKRRDSDFLDIEYATPFHTERTKTIELTDSRNTVRCYNGYFHASSPGIYTFKLPGRIGDNGNLGSLQATCQNQLKVDDEFVVQRGVYGRNPTGQIALKEGWHRISFRFGPGKGFADVLLPDGQMLSLNGENIFRNTLVSVACDGNNIKQSPFEIYKPVKVTLGLPENINADIRYTLDGKIPEITSLKYIEPLNIDQSKKLCAAAFLNGRMITAPVTMDFQLVSVPNLGLLGSTDFTRWDGKPGPYYQTPFYQVWLAPYDISINESTRKVLAMLASATDKASNVDVNVSRGGNHAGLKLRHITMRENALSVAIWFKTSEMTGKLFGKDGYNAFGKGYKTFSCSMDNGRLMASPGHLAGGKIEPNTWSFVLLSADEKEMSLYLNGEKVATGPGTKDISTDALDFFVDHGAYLSELKVFDRLLNAEEVKHLYQATNTYK